ncbi:MAG: RNA polymerase sigma factor [Patescibacteria group bacterium]|mgnify:CR=1 FL=1
MDPNNTEKIFLEGYDALADALFRHCYFRMSDRERAKDIVQDAFVKTWRYLAAGKGIHNLKAFLYRVVDNEIIDYSRKRKEQSLDALMEEGFDVGSLDTEMRIERLDAKRALAYLDYLDERSRQVVVMRFIDDLGPKQIAEVTGERENIISVRIHRALAKLRKIITDHEAHH